MAPSLKIHFRFPDQIRWSWCCRYGDLRSPGRTWLHSSRRRSEETSPQPAGTTGRETETRLWKGRSPSGAVPAFFSRTLSSLTHLSRSHWHRISSLNAPVLPTTLCWMLAMVVASFTISIMPAWKSNEERLNIPERHVPPAHPPLVEMSNLFGFPWRCSRTVGGRGPGTRSPRWTPWSAGSEGGG